MSLLNIAVKAFQTKGEFPEVLRLESLDLSFNGNETIEARWKNSKSSAKSCPPTCIGYSEPIKHEMHLWQIKKLHSISVFKWYCTRI